MTDFVSENNASTPFRAGVTSYNCTTHNNNKYNHATFLKHQFYEKQNTPPLPPPCRHTFAGADMAMGKAKYGWMGL